MQPFLPSLYRRLCSWFLAGDEKPKTKSDPETRLTFKPAKRASPLSRTTFMTCPWRAVPNSFKARSDRMAEPGGIISDPGNLDFLRMRSRGIEASIGKKRNRPPNLVRKDRGLRSSCRTSATSAVVGREL